MDYDVIIQKLEDYFTPEKNVTYERHIFFLINQKDDESIDNYVTELSDLSAACEFRSEL